MRDPLIGNSMTYERKVLSMQIVLPQAWAMVRSTWPEILKILVLGVVLPHLAINLYFDLRDQVPVAALQGLVIRLGKSRDAVSYRELLTPILDYAAQLGSALFLAILAALVSYLGIVHICVHFAQTGTPLSFGSALIRGFKTSIPKGVFLFFLALFLAGTLGQIAFAPVILFLVLVSMLPVILAVEHKGAFWSFKSAISIGYIRRTGYSGWNVFFTLMTVVATLYTIVAVAAFGGQQLLVLDEIMGLPRTFWLWNFPGASFGLIYLVLLMLETLVMSLVFCLAPALTVAIYFLVASKRELAQV